MGFFDRKKVEPAPLPPAPPPLTKIEPAITEPPKPPQELEEIKERVETPIPIISQPEPPKMETFNEPPKEELSVQPLNINIESRPEPTALGATPILYVKLTEYKQVVEATNNMRKDVEKIKGIVLDLRKIEKEETLRLDKSEELIKEINNIINLFEKTMVAPTE